MALLSFDSWLAGYTRGAVPHMAIGLTLHFASQTMHVWPGVGPVVADDRIFQGVGAVGEISGLEIGLGRPTETTSVVLSGLDGDFFALAADQESEARGRRAEIWFLGFGTGVPGEEWALAAASLEATREMDRMTRSIDYETMTSTITLTMEPIGAMRWKSPAGYLTDDDQRARYPTDRGLERVPLTTFSRPMVW